ncbi:putative transcription factor HES-5-like [Scophthalmus maximus]|uniref:Transcription factor HES-5 n=2 Tax=Scophthalmus maximus TaxID=52904 RepID=A0A2U9BYN6_SCOMX|nr:putative transcription factor HES-5-like [Scophthalmus maximus]
MHRYKPSELLTRSIVVLGVPLSSHPPSRGSDSPHLHTDMAPCSTNYSTMHHIRISVKDNLKLRKPAVEKMRRDRINTCIEQLKVILEKEFHKQEPNSKLEKADILEMTVSFLRQQLQPGVCHSDYNRGYSHCWRDSLHFLSAGSGTEAPVTPLQGLQQQKQKLHQAQRGSSSSPVCSPIRPTTLQDSSSSSSSSSSRGPVWRPW